MNKKLQQDDIVFTKILWHSVRLKPFQRVWKISKRIVDDG